MKERESRIAGGDYERAGDASRALKEELKRIGVSPEIIRRVTIAAYEAETNVVIHARGGLLKSRVDEGKVEVEILDEGPGIEDIDRAMTEGYSTAPSAAREMGFGAGMGLPNIKRNTDRFTIESDRGRGTRLSFTVYLKAMEAWGHGRNSIGVTASRCTKCLACLRACPTGAMRVRESGPEVLEYLCIDCAGCVEACRVGALCVKETVEHVTPRPDTVLVVSPGFLTQFEPVGKAEAVKRALSGLGFAGVMVTGEAETGLREAVREYARDARVQPVISPMCPAVVNLIETRFPSLIGNVAPFLSPVEAVREGLIGRRAAFVVMCPSQKTVLEEGSGPATVEVLLPGAMRGEVTQRLGSGGGKGTGAFYDRVSAEAEKKQGEAAEIVTGTADVMRVLEEMENGDRAGRGVVEMYGCRGGCFGSPLLMREASVAGRSWRDASSSGKGVRRKKELRARPGMRLDGDMREAIRKLGEIERLKKGLPGMDCGLCGSPTCGAYAEDVVLGRVKGVECPRVQAKRRDGR